MLRVLGMMASFAFAGLNGWFLMPGHHGTVLNVMAAMLCLGSGVYVMASLVRYP